MMSEIKSWIPIKMLIFALNDGSLDAIDLKPNQKNY